MTLSNKTEKPHATVATIVEKDGLYLLVKELRDGHIVYNQPAGHIENGESVAQAAIRETLEETGWHIEPVAVGGLSMYHAANGISYLRTTLIAEAVQRESNPQLDDGILEAIWFTYEEVVALGSQLRSPIVLKVIDDYRRGVRYPMALIYEHG